MKRTVPYLMMFVVAVAGALPAVAHEGHSHGKTHKMMGTIRAVHPDMSHVEMTGTDGKKQEFYVNTTTRYLKGNMKLTLADLTPGTRVVVDAKMEGQKMLATVVKVGAARKTGSQPPK